MKKISLALILLTFLAPLALQSTSLERSNFIADNAFTLSETEADGSEAKTVNGVPVIQNNKLINPSLVDDLGRTNVQRMQQGLAPIGPDGRSLNLHHVNQTMAGPVQEITATLHQQNYVQLHANTGQAASQINRPAFNIWRADYWINRAGDF